MDSTTATDDKALEVSFSNIWNLHFGNNYLPGFVKFNDDNSQFINNNIPYTTTCKLKKLSFSIYSANKKHFRHFEIDLGNLDNLLKLELNYNEETDFFETETKGVFIEETTKYLQFKCDIEDVNAFMVNDIVSPINKKIPCNFNSKQDIKFGHIDNEGNFLDCEKQPFIKNMCVENFNENTYDYDNTAIINVNDKNGKLNISCDNATITFDEEHSKIINNKVPTIASFSLGGIFASSAVGFAIAAFAFSLAISPIIAGIIIAVSALASASCFIYGIIKKSHTYTPKKDEIQETETENSEEVIPNIINDETNIENNETNIENNDSVEHKPPTDNSNFLDSISEL